MYIGFDPGKDKCGVAIVDRQGQALWHQVVPSATVLEILIQQHQEYSPIKALVMGDQTLSKQWQTQIQKALPELPIHRIDERYSSLEARDRYWQLYPARGLSKLMPQGMRQPPRPIDDLVAIILVERYLAKHLA
jgi:RNase H-fold protein (predicted Holliday junction resolvase)